ncbi:hypothetical protein NL676_009971 [Syzygium grande]|nr:hypothetical protein NL676_009971 [Syzygium grande]
MDEAPAKWNVTFTKHLKQKRKVYRDGFLSLHTPPPARCVPGLSLTDLRHSCPSSTRSANLVMLYDDSEQLLECRILKNDEVVSSGETLTFNAYLVDVGEPEGGQKPPDDTYTRSQENKVLKRTNLLHRKKFVNVSDCAGDEKTKVEKDKQQAIGLSPSQKIIREFKKNEMNKYGILQASPNSRTSSMADWHALYTTHLTQKSKKYHDGFLRCTSSGSMTRQVFLYDMSWKLLDSRFLNKAEEVSPGEMMEFPGHLVEVGNSEANHESLRDLNACGNSFNSLHKSNMQKQQHNCTTVKSAVQRKVLANKFLRKDEVLGTGKSLVLDSHLVDIGEHEVEEKVPVGLNDREPCRAAGEMRKGHGEVNGVKVDQPILGDQVAVVENSCEREATFASLTKELQHLNNSSDGAQRQRALAAKLASVENVDTGNLTDTTGNETSPGFMKSEGSASDFNEFHATVGFGIGNSQPSLEPADLKCCGNNLASEASLSRGSPGDANDERTTPEGDRDPLKVKAECPSFDLGF